MSVEKQLEEARRWMRQAASDVDAARGSRGLCKFDWACFQAQQSAEKAVKAVWLGMGLDPWGHNVARLVRDLPDGPQRAALASLGVSAARLDKLYIPTRYPNGLPDVAPADAYTAEEADAAIDDAERLVAACRALVEAVP